MATTKAKKCLFERNLISNHKGIIAKRSKRFTDETIAESNIYIQNIESKIRKAKNKQEDLEDLHPSSTTSLQINEDGVSGKYWVETMNQVTLELNELELELEIAQKVHEKYFV